MEIKTNQKWKYGNTLLFSTAVIDIKSMAGNRVWVWFKLNQYNPYSQEVNLASYKIQKNLEKKNKFYNN